MSPEANVTCVEVSEAIRAQGIDDVTRWPLVQAIFGLVYGVIFLIGLCGNGGIIVAVVQNKRLRSARNIFLCNLIATDMILCVTGIPVTPIYALSKDWRFGAVMCRLMPLSNSCSVFVTSWSLTAIAVDKFVHITNPTRAAVSLKMAVFITVVIWTMCSLVNIPYLLSYELIDGSYYVTDKATPFCGHFCDEIHWSSDTHRRLYGSAVMLLQFVVPMALITYCYSRILNKVAKDMIIHNMQFSQSLTTAQRIEAVNRKKRVNYILIAMVGTFIGCWFPLTAVNLAKDFRVEPEFMRRQPYLWPLIAHSIAMSTVIWNPLLFFWLARKQKAQLKLTNILNTSEIVTSLVSRIHSFRTTNSTNSDELKPKKGKGDEFRPVVITENGSSKFALHKSTSLRTNML
ncbi:hypothetical protein QR680_005030 [Steinernema hermaphroditum]|uniref:G-protein coupled receptors family 1 profile domain-containing protein n=1 Tax=Steinernema hermaphroditum TaxID=289476 RepID=A0AA39HSX3_9BILA|nr:hypothetical protein QR680_005030 [Steinernema hermaphroditum]